MSVTDDVRAMQPPGGDRPPRSSGDGGFERTPPQDIAAEQCVLGGMLLSKDAIADVVEIVRTVDFYRPAHATIFDAILDLYGRGEPADPITVAAALSDSGDLGRIGGVPYLHDLVAIVPTAANAAYYGRIVSERAVLRRLVEAGTRIVQLGYGAAGGGGRDVDETVDLAQQEVYNVTEKRVSEDFAVLAELLQPTLDEIEAVGAQGGVMTGVPTGFTDLDRLLNGLHAGQLIIVAGRPGLGKCISGETLVTEASTGRPMQIAELVRRGLAGQRLAVHTLSDAWRFDTVSPSAFVPNGRRPVLRLTTRSGRAIRATANHPFRLLTGWRSLGDLRSGDHVAVPAAAGGRDDDLFPAAVWPVIVAEKGALAWAEVSERCGRPRDYDWRVGRSAVSRALLADLAKALDSDALRDLAAGDVGWDEVVSVAPDGEADVYDLTVDGTHNFVAGGFVVHNSTAGMDFARAASVRNNLASAIFSLEMSKVEIVMRLLSAEARVPLHVLRSGQLSDDDWTKLARRMGEISEAPLFVDDTPNMTLMEIRAKARRLKQRNDLKLIVVDYLQLMTSPKRVESRQQEVAELSRGLKLLAKEVECPVVAVSQLNRGPEQRTDKRPQLSDLRESGCMTEDTTILRADTGAPVTFRELLDGGCEGVLVWSIDEHRRLVPAPLTRVFPSGVKEVYRLTLASGRVVKASGNHPFLTFGGWSPLESLAVGSRIAVPRRLPPPVTAGLGWSENRLGLLAHLLGDGCVLARQPIHYTSQDEANLTFVERAAATEFGITARRVRQGNWQHTYLPSPYHLTHGRHNPIAEWFRDLGINDLRSYEKRLPDVLYSADDGEIRTFLRHLWATDGSVTVPTGRTGKTAGRVYYSTSSRALADGVVHLLARLGLATRLYPVAYGQSTRPGYHVVVAGVRDARRFCEEIGVHGARGESVDAYLDYSAGKAGNTNVDTLPREVWDVVKAERTRVGLTERQFQAAIGTAYCGSTLYKSCPSRERLLRCAEALGSEALRAAATDDILWDRVVAIEPLGAQPVYDATVKGTHNFVADGIIAHNSIEQDADVVILLHRDDYYDKESPRAGEADFIVAKHRNGPTDTITVAAQLHLSRFVDMAIV